MIRVKELLSMLAERELMAEMQMNSGDDSSARDAARGMIAEIKAVRKWAIANDDGLDYEE